MVALLGLLIGFGDVSTAHAWSMTGDKAGAAFQGWYPGDGNVRFVDLTGSTYAGSDDDLIGIGLQKIGLGCAGSASFPGPSVSVSWEDRSGRFIAVKPGFVYPGGPPMLRPKNYSIHFRVKDRRGQVVHEEDFDFVGNAPGVQKGRVYHGRNTQDTWGCDRDYIKFSKDLNLAYATIEYWFTKIEWSSKP